MYGGNSNSGAKAGDGSGQESGFSGETPAGYDPFNGQDILLSGRPGKTIHWSISWADLMMTMFILFVVMYVYQAGNRELVYGDGPGKTGISDSGRSVVVKNTSRQALGQESAAVYELSRGALDMSFLADVADVDLVDDETIRIVLTGDLLFAPGRTDLRGEARGVLGGLAAVLNRTDHMVEVMGHTDSVPYHSEQFPTNWELSVIRACKVARFLMEEMRIPGYRFIVSGQAYHRPVKPNTTAENRAANRRVEIILSKRP